MEFKKNSKSSILVWKHYIFTENTKKKNQRLTVITNSCPTVAEDFTLNYKNMFLYFQTTGPSLIFLSVFLLFNSLPRLATLFRSPAHCRLTSKSCLEKETFDHLDLQCFLMSKHQHHTSVVSVNSKCHGTTEIWFLKTKLSWKNPRTDGVDHFVKTIKHSTISNLVSFKAVLLLCLRPYVGNSELKRPCRGWNTVVGKKGGEL